MNDAESATGEMRRAFATLLLFVLVSIPAEAYTKSAYGEVLSNIDALHFLIQSAISLTNLRILLAFRDVNTEREEETSTRVDAGRPGKVVEAFAGVGLLATALLLSLDARLLVVPDGSPAALVTSVEAFRSVSYTHLRAHATGRKRLSPRQREKKKGARAERADVGRAHF